MAVMMIVRFLVASCGALTAMSAAGAQQPATARLVVCGAEDCLLIRGHRDASQPTVSVNGRKVEATGGMAWRVHLPVATVRDWSRAHARTINIAVGDADGSADRSETVRLPVGLLGGRVELAALVVRAR